MTNTNTTAGSALAVSGNQDFWSAGQLAALKQLGVQNATQGDLQVFLNFAQRTGLDPFARQIYMIGRRQKAGNDWVTKWTIQASIDGLRIVAERSGDYAGQVGPEYCGTDGIWRDTWVAPQPPVAARVGVLRHGFSTPLYAVAYWDEYVQTSNGQPTTMWASKPRLMLAKCAEALALRKAFPNDLAGLYTADEMGHADHQAPAAPAPVAPLTSVADGEQVYEGQVVDEATGEVEAESDLATQAQVKAIAAMLTKTGRKDADARHTYVTNLVGRTVGSSSELTKAEASQVIETLKPECDAIDAGQQ